MRTITESMNMSTGRGGLCYKFTHVLELHRATQKRLRLRKIKAYVTLEWKYGNTPASCFIAVFRCTRGTGALICYLEAVHKLRRRRGMAPWLVAVFRRTREQKTSRSLHHKKLIHLLVFVNYDMCESTCYNAQPRHPSCANSAHWFELRSPRAQPFKSMSHRYVYACKSRNNLYFLQQRCVT